METSTAAHGNIYGIGSVPSKPLLEHCIKRLEKPPVHRPSRYGVPVIYGYDFIGGRQLAVFGGRSALLGRENDIGNFDSDIRETCVAQSRFRRRRQ